MYHSGASWYNPSLLPDNTLKTSLWVFRVCNKFCNMVTKVPTLVTVTYISTVKVQTNVPQWYIIVTFKWNGLIFQTIYLYRAGQWLTKIPSPGLCFIFYPSPSPDKFSFLPGFLNRFCSKLTTHFQYHYNL